MEGKIPENQPERSSKEWKDGGRKPERERSRNGSESGREKRSWVQGAALPVS